MRPIPMNIVKVIQSAENLLDLIKVPHIARSVPEIVTMTPPQSSPICYIHTFGIFVPAFEWLSRLCMTDGYNDMHN